MSDVVNGICREEFPGGTIITIRDASLPVVRWVAAAPGGAALDGEGKSGALSMTMDLMLRGTQEKSRQIFSEKLEGLGSSLTALGGNEMAFLRGLSLKRNLNETLGLMREAVLEPAFDETEFEKLLSSLKIEETISGGSVANSIVGLSQLGNKVGFIGKVSDDELGQKYEDGLNKENVEYLYRKKKELIPTGSCLILITPDSERTMCTFLGTAGKISEDDVNKEHIKNSEIVFLEGYLWDEGDPKKAFDLAITYSNKVAMSLSDLFCVERHKPYFLELVKNQLDIIFANEQEILSLINARSFNEVISFSKEIKKNIIITRGEKGALSIKDGEVYECEAKKNLKITDLTGAGDLFAAGYLDGIINNKNINECLKKGNELSSKIIQKVGARI